LVPVLVENWQFVDGIKQKWSRKWCVDRESYLIAVEEAGELAV